MDKVDTALAEFHPLTTAIAGLVEPCTQIKVLDAESSGNAIVAAKDIKSLMTAIESKRKELVEPLNREVKVINEYVKEITGSLVKADAYLRTQLGTYAAMLEAKRRHEQDRIDAEKRAEYEALRLLREKEDQEARDLFGVGPEIEIKRQQEDMKLIAEHDAKIYDVKQETIRNTRMVWKCELEDITKVPMEFLIITLNEKAVLAAAKAGDTIPGVRTWEMATVAIGRNTRGPAPKSLSEFCGESEYG